MKKKPALKVQPAGRTPAEDDQFQDKGIKVTENGTLCIQLQDGQPVEVRNRLLFHSKRQKVGVDDLGPALQEGNQEI